MGSEIYTFFPNASSIISDSRPILRTFSVLDLRRWRRRDVKHGGLSVSRVSTARTLWSNICAASIFRTTN